MRIKNMYIVRGLNGVEDIPSKPGYNKVYETAEAAHRVAVICTQNASNAARRNAFIIYKAYAIVMPADTPVMTRSINDLGEVLEE